MKKVYVKLTAMTLLLLVSIVAVVSASYAWFTLSENPTVSGIQITLSGGSTILIAADQTTTVDGVTYHFPGAFSDSLNFSQLDSYAYLQNLGGLSPVSTADGIHWFRPTFYGENDAEVIQGLVSKGQLRPVQQFQLDDRLTFANQMAESEDLTRGHYVFLDFWVVSPGSDYKLRISTGEEGGSFVIDLLDYVSSGDAATGFTLSDNGISSTSTSVRVGFLTSEQHVTDHTMVFYQKTPGYNSDYTGLRGIYAQQGSPVENPESYRFTIFEPNADAHPSSKVEDGCYIATYPLAMVNGVPTPTKVLNRTSAQLTSWWSQAVSGSGLMLEQVFQTALYGKQDTQAAADSFYTGYLQGQFSSLIDKGAFIQNTASLDDYISPERLQTLAKAGATDDVYIIELERNIPQRIRMFVWLEGQDPDWDPSNASKSFAVNIEFAGSNE